MLPDAFSVARLIRSRIAVAGSGAWRMRQGKHGMRVVSILPGADFSAKLELTSHGKHLGQMFYPNGRPLSTLMDMRDPKRFASFMHNLDCCICDIPEAGVTPTPVEALYFADAASASRDPAVQAAVEEIYADGAELDICRDNVRWRIPETHRGLVEVCLTSNDATAAEAARTLVSVDDGSKPSSTFDSHASLKRWNRLVDQWILQAHGAEQTSIQAADGLNWIRLETEPAVVAAAREIGRLEGEFIDLGGPSLLDIVRGAKLDDTRQGAKPGPHIMDESKAFYALMKENSVIALAVYEGGLLELHGPRNGQWLAESYPAFMDLTRELGTDGPRP